MSISARDLITAAVDVGLVTRDQAEDVGLEVRRTGGDQLELLMKRCRAPKAAFYRAMAHVMKIPFLDLSSYEVPSDWLESLHAPLLARSRALPVRLEGDRVLCAAADPSDPSLEATLQRMLGRPVQLGLAEPELLDIQLARLLDPGSDAVLGSSDPVEYMDGLMYQAYIHRASDIHIEPAEHACEVRFRVDGALQSIVKGISHDDGQALISRVKVLAGLDISEQRAPQDGGFSYEGLDSGGTQIDVRVATLPTRWGERATLRLLGAAREALTLDALGMGEEDVNRFRRVIRKPYGMILLTGPTGSGKTTTLYAALEEIRNPELNIMTVEDPIEQPLEGSSQVQVVSEKVGFTTALRAFLRHDPDVLMVGEIRDPETTDVALKAAMTGHLLLSSLHTNDAVSAVTRLRDLGAPAFLIGSSLLLVVAQRLVMRLCEVCREERSATKDEIKFFNFEEGAKVWEPTGCPRCLGSGYSGRIGLFEFLPINERVSELIAADALEGQIREAAGEELTSFYDDGRAKVLSGMTTAQEIRRIVDFRVM